MTDQFDDAVKVPKQNLSVFVIWWVIYTETLRILKESHTKQDAIIRIKHELRPNEMEVGY